MSTPEFDGTSFFSIGGMIGFDPVSGFPIEEQVAYLSTFTTLEPGDLIFTGTPEGVGGRKRIYLQAGDVIRTEIEGVGEMRNRCVSDA